MTDIVERLRQAKAEYDKGGSEFYDEVLHEVSDRAAAAGSVGKLEIGALVLWKRIRADSPWTKHLMSMFDAEVRAITSRAMAAANDLTATVVEAAEKARVELLPLPGCRTSRAVPSAILTAMAPARMAVYDRRAHNGLWDLFDGDVPRRYSYHQYIEVVDGLREQLGDGWTNRDVDLALYTLGGPQGADS